MTPLELPPVEAILSQGDVIDECPLYSLPPDGDMASSPPPKVFHERVIVLTQACDLAQAKADRVVVALVHRAEDLVRSGFVKPAAVRDQIRRGLMFGWYFLPADAPCGLPESLVDLRDLHTVPRPVLERLVAAGKRVARLVTPFREHLAQHFAVTYMRIALPEPYETAP